MPTPIVKQLGRIQSEIAEVYQAMNTVRGSISELSDFLADATPDELDRYVKVTTADFEPQNNAHK